MEIICHEIKREKPVFSDRYGVEVDHVDLYAQVGGRMLWISSRAVGMSEADQDTEEARAQEILEQFLLSDGRFVCFAAPAGPFLDPFDFLCSVESHGYNIDGFKCSLEAAHGFYVFAGTIIETKGRFKYHIFNKGLVQELAARLLGRLGDDVDSILNRVIDGEPPAEADEDIESRFVENAVAA